MRTRDKRQTLKRGVMSLLFVVWFVHFQFKYDLCAYHGVFEYRGKSRCTCNQAESSDDPSPTEKKGK